ncbi:DNA topoisomerase III [Tuberibacillus sp. Marseille-P3662]|uniref:DNA topoisomerase III n=1 Tax=Tuberibacillus sp. Marseille-P3662 TaxID=1965358 RepID=UPI000A1CF08B|nr:DNA topoisomerase III [Tuberibacillus sp. Marseille-P3662]
MGKSLVLAEKPSVGRDIARVLNCKKKGNGFLEGDNYIVTWALGHLVTLADPEVYDDQYKTWRLDDLPMLPSQLKLVVIKKSGKQFSTVKAQMHRKDVSDIVIATDAGREGELVARWIIEKARVKKPIKRLWISSVTDKAIKDGFKHIKSGKAYDNLYRAAVARAEADWYVGLNASRALTTKYNASLSCGRVQTPTLRMIAKREEEIKQFTPKPYYGITAKTDRIQLTWQDAKNNTRIFDESKCDRIIKAVQNQQATVTDVNKNAKKSYAPQLYDLTNLQRDAHKFFGMSAKDTLSTMQRLYEQHKLVTYPRTDSRHLSSDMVGTLKDRIGACNIGPYRKAAAKALKRPIKPTKAFVDDKKVSDHHAIIPTEQPALLSDLSDKEQKIYDLIVKRFLAILYPPHEYEQTTIVAKIGDETFTAKGKRVITSGWKEVYDQNLDDESGESSEDQHLPDIKKGESLNVQAVTKTAGETKPPKPFNEGTLLQAMENPIKYMESDNKDLKKTIGQTGGLGTVATRADIIDKLYNSFLIEEKGTGISITSKGKQLLELVPEDLKSPVLTAEWEQKLESIANGSLNQNTFMDEIKGYTKDAVNEIKDSDKTFKHQNKTGTRCPECGKFMLEVNNKKGKMLVCQDRECGYRQNKMKITNARCPNCKKKLELHGHGEGQMFVCQCGHREKLSTFNERKKKEKTKASKHDVKNYLKKQDDEPVNTALADQLAKLNLDNKE